ncbi:MAG: ATP-binding cassette domain-containing protein [Mariniphaga sp.]|jgi:energy-coupling factor transport system ATP-binding protein|nr:ATP-binding cassette domain-containing protein [Mariniphaga sp.]
MITIDSLNFSYDEKRKKTLRDINLEIAENEFIILAGESGSGKSTLLKAIAGIIPGYETGIFKGKIINNKLDTQKEKLYTVSQKTGILFQNPDSQFFNLSVEDEICFGMLNRGWTDDKIKSRLEEIISLFELQKVRKLPPTQLSEGQKQRTVLASILATYPRLLLLDEPFAHLDEKQTDTIIDLLLRLKALGTTIVIAEHRLSKLIPVASRVLVMQKGEIIHDIEPDKLLNEAFTKGLGLRDILIKPTEMNWLKASRSNCIVGVENGQIQYRGGFSLGIQQFYAETGKKIALLGPNGSGKTSLLKVLSGLKQIKNGTTIPKKIRPGKLSTLVYQQTDNQLFMDTVEKEVLQFSTNPGLAEELLQYFGLSEYRQFSPFSLSEGEKQRVVLAASLSRGAPVLLLDEPTTGMDGRQLNNFIQLLHNDILRKTSCIIATHDAQLIQQGTKEQFLITST